MFPPIPPWNGLHPPIVHFPIALFIVAPLFVFLSAAVPRRRTCFAVCALALMTLAWIGASAAVLTGHAAARGAHLSPAALETLRTHAYLAGITRAAFTVLIPAYGLFLAFPFYRDTPFSRRTDATLHAAFLSIYLCGMVLLANTADHGGHLVHVFGVHAPLRLPPPHP